MEEILNIICIVAIGLFILLVYIASILKRLSSHSLYRNSVLTETLTSLSKILIAERIMLKNEYNIDLEEFYSKYMSERDKVKLDKNLKDCHHDY